MWHRRSAAPVTELPFSPAHTRITPTPPSSVSTSNHVSLLNHFFLMDGLHIFCLIYVSGSQLPCLRTYTAASCTRCSLGLFSIATISWVVLITVSGFNEILSIPHLTKKRANSEIVARRLTTNADLSAALTCPPDHLLDQSSHRRIPLIKKMRHDC